MEKFFSRTETKYLSALFQFFNKEKKARNWCLRFWKQSFQKIHKFQLFPHRNEYQRLQKNHLCSNQPCWVTMVASIGTTPGTSWKHETHFSSCKSCFMTCCLACQVKKQKETVSFQWENASSILTRKYSKKSMKTYFSLHKSLLLGNNQPHMHCFAPQHNGDKRMEKRSGFG